MKTLSLPSDPFLRGYLMSAFWTNDDDAPSGEYSDSGRPEEMMANLSPEALERATADCAAFEERASDLLSAAYDRDYDHEQAGHDFWLTRNGHGTGFWDREALKPQGDEWEATCIPLDEWTPETRAMRDLLKKESLGHRLSEAARASGSCDLYTGDDGKLYF